MDGWNTIVSFWGPAYVSFRQGISNPFHHLTPIGCGIPSDDAALSLAWADLRGQRGAEGGTRLQTTQGSLPPGKLYNMSPVSVIGSDVIISYTSLFRGHVSFSGSLNEIKLDASVSFGDFEAFSRQKNLSALFGGVIFSNPGFFWSWVMSGSASLYFFWNIGGLKIAIAGGTAYFQNLRS